MARIRAVYPHLKDRLGKHKDTDAFVAVFVHEGDKFLQIHSQGSDERQDKGTMSQNLLFDLRTLREFIRIVRDEFPEAL